MPDTIMRFEAEAGFSRKSAATLILLAVLSLGGFLAAHYMDTNGHHVTGMNNQVVWGIPHVIAIFLILSASGALNVASVSSVFGIDAYKPWARLSGLLAIGLLIGGLLVLVLDLGRPDRLIVAMTHYNFRSIFAWNIFLYTGFTVVVIVYLWMMFEGRFNRHTRIAGTVAFIWRIVLTCGTGAIFGVLVARQGFYAAILIPLFIALSLALGTAVFVLVTRLVLDSDVPRLTDQMLSRLGRLLALFVTIVLSLTAMFHLTNLYALEHRAFERFILVDGGVYTALFWIVQVGLGGIVPLVILWSPRFCTDSRYVLTGAALVIVGAIAQLYVIIIGGQAYPLVLFPGKSISSNFYDGVVAEYTPSVVEFMLAIGGIAVALLVIVLVCRVLPFLPVRSAQKR